VNPDNPSNLSVHDEIAALKKTIQELEQQKLAKDLILQESEKRLQSALEQLGAFALSIDDKDRITYCNELFLTFTGWEKRMY
jgi:PAS domain-containing protein